MSLFAIAECIAGAIQIVICLVFTPIFGFNIVGISSTFFFVAIDAVTFAILRHELGRIGFKSIFASGVRALVLGAVGALVGAGILMLLQMLVGPIAGGGMMRSLLYCIVGGVPALIVTFGFAISRQMPEVAVLSAMVKRFIPRRA